MNEVNCMSEEELRAHLKKMEKNKEELKFQEQRIWKEEEEEDEQIYAALVGLEPVSYTHLTLPTTERV